MLQAPVGGVVATSGHEENGLMKSQVCKELDSTCDKTNIRYEFQFLLPQLGLGSSFDLWKTPGKLTEREKKQNI